jgi:hypothetical protein
MTLTLITMGTSNKTIVDGISSSSSNKSRSSGYHLITVMLTMAMINNITTIINLISIMMALDSSSRRI